jgi:iron complex transport system ATP-binding protein
VEVLQGHLLNRVYEVPVEVGILRGAAHLSILPPQTSDTAQQDTPALVSHGARPRQAGPHLPVHIFGGGGSAEVLMRGLADAGIPFSIGALNIGDSDHALALRLAANLISEQPYAPIAPGTAAQVQQRLGQARAQILCPFFIGAGNLILLELALEATRQGVLTVLLEPGGAANGSGPDQSWVRAQIASRDYTGGEGAVLYEALMAQHPLLAGNAAQAIRLLTAAISTGTTQKGRHYNG